MYKFVLVLFPHSSIFVANIYFYLLIIYASEKNCEDDTFIRNSKKFENSKDETILGLTITNELLIAM